MHERLTGCGNVGQQLWRCFQVPVRVRDAGVSHIGGEGERMATDRMTGFWTLLEGSHGKGMSQVHQPETSTSGAMGNPGGLEDLMKGFRYHRVGEFATAAR